MKATIQYVLMAHIHHVGWKQIHLFPFHQLPHPTPYTLFAKDILIGLFVNDPYIINTESILIANGFGNKSSTEEKQ